MPSQNIKSECVCRKHACTNTHVYSGPMKMLKTAPFTQTALITRPTDTCDPRCLTNGHPPREKYALLTALWLRLRLNESRRNIINYTLRIGNDVSNTFDRIKEKKSVLTNKIVSCFINLVVCAIKVIKKIIYFERFRGETAVRIES